ncbi:hypothetical protein G6M87_10865 [Rhizobium rhizogenes]|uniref:hypothetical protein n=1 Tax=Rhizobium rhizogenes TaxID=359 RepID=UPI001574C432|nr:hypothetical protein [Rhizobium rhizogenes]NTI22358.1 hypothetical protein [Rhizobium rhizogenes]QTG05946.1 hypothetical protein G6M87_10865 [Rhizobium rhizogenes]
MKHLWWRMHVTYWFRRKSDMSFIDAWKYAKDMTDYFIENNDPTTAREAVEIEMSYWEC